MNKIETYEEAVKRTGRRWPYRTADWPCPACFDPNCDLDIILAWHGRQHGIPTFVYQHAKESMSSVEGLNEQR